MIHAEQPSVDLEHSVRWTIMSQYVFVHQGFKAIHLWLVLRLGAVKTLTVPLMRNAALLLVAVSPRKNASPFAILAIVLLEQIVQQETTGNPVLAGFL